MSDTSGPANDISAPAHDISAPANGAAVGAGKTIRVLLADDHRILREGLRALLSAQPDIVVVGDARDGVEALEQVEALAPDVVVMDLVMPRMSGMEATARIHEAHPEVKILILSMYDDDEYVQRVIQAGASGYALKGVASDELVRAIREVQGGSVLPAARHRREAHRGLSCGACVTTSRRRPAVRWRARSGRRGRRRGRRCGRRRGRGRRGSADAA